MKEVYEFLKECGTYYLATIEDNKPRVRPFGTINLFEDKLYIQTGKSKKVYKQIEHGRPQDGRPFSEAQRCGDRRRCP